MIPSTGWVWRFVWFGQGVDSGPGGAELPEGVEDPEGPETASEPPVEGALESRGVTSPSMEEM